MMGPRAPGSSLIVRDGGVRPHEDEPRVRMSIGDQERMREDCPRAGVKRRSPPTSVGF